MVISSCVRIRSSDLLGLFFDTRGKLFGKPAIKCIRDIRDMVSRLVVLVSIQLIRINPQ